jgi:hypothetical protein
MAYLKAATHNHEEQVSLVAFREEDVPGLYEHPFCR